MVVQDPIATEVVGNRLAAIADEMSATLIRSAYSTMIKESADGSAAILDRGGKLLGQSAGTLVLHTASLRECLKAIMEDFPPDAMQEGDAFLMNDPYRGGIHSNDIAVFVPVVIRGSVHYFAGTLVHVADVGGVSSGGLPSQVTDVFQEGLLIPPMKMRSKGVQLREVSRLIALNSRSPTKVLGDLDALLAAATVGARRMVELEARYRGALEGVLKQVLAYTEARVRADIRKIPIGEWSATFTVDDDGVVPDRPYKIRLTVRHCKEDELEIDLGGTDAQATGPINAAFSQALSGVVIGVRCFLSADIRMNEGVFVPIKPILPFGTIVNPGKPAPLNARAVVVSGIVEAILSILGTIWPERAVAGSAMVHLYTMNGRGANSGSWQFMDIDFGGTGARIGLDGVNASGPYFFGGRSLTIQMEPIEREYPVRFTRLRLIPDSGGPGRWRGGAGVHRELVCLEAAETTVRADRVVYPPAGKNGGATGRAGGWSIAFRGVEKRLRSKEMGLPLSKGATLCMLTSGGGGMGDALERPVDAVLEDVLCGIVSLTGAEHDYGVVIDPDTDRVDVTATRMLRARLKGRH